MDSRLRGNDSVWMLETFRLSLLGQDVEKIPSFVPIPSYNSPSGMWKVELREPSSAGKYSPYEAKRTDVIGETS
jgi:hypothetical protein